MKKIFALLLMVIMSVTLFAGCGTDPVYEDLSNFLNVEMVEVNAEYEKLNEAIDVKIFSIKNGEASVNSKNGEIKVSDVTLTLRDAELLQYAQNISNDYGENFGNLFIQG